METLLSLLIQLESLEIMHRNGELLKIQLDSLRIHLAICFGKCNHSMPRIDSDSFGPFLFSTFTNLFSYTLWLRIVFTSNFNFIIEKERMIFKWRYSMGEMNREQNPPQKDRRFPADRKKNYVRYSNFHQKLRNKRLNMIWTNWWCRD